MRSNGDRVIISASRRTDIPAFYSEWFMNRIRAGYFVKVNPYNPKQQKQVSLLEPDVAVIVFWTKNPQPLMEHLLLLDSYKYHYLFQFTLNHYNRILEPGVPALQERIMTFQRLSDQIGSERVMWRYDPIIVSNLDSVDNHLERFQQIAELLKGYTHRVTISLLTLYSKVTANIKRLASEQTLHLIDLRSDEQRDQLNRLVHGLRFIAEEYGLAIYSCSEKLNLLDYNILPGSCIDSQLINKIFNLNLMNAKDKYQRLECRCAPSIDMGHYDTCQFGCAYCYANTSMKRVLKNTSQYDPSSPILLRTLIP
jgi:DNA repair photolyase